MRKGEPVAGTEFFNLLYSDDAFCRDLGRAMLAAGRLETELKLYLEATTVSDDTKRLTLGQLLATAKKHAVLNDMQGVLEMLKDQRNYLAHSIYPLFSGSVEETLLPRSDLLNSDVDVFTERAWQLSQNLNDLADLVARRRHA
jgi:hypothetical protein